MTTPKKNTESPEAREKRLERRRMIDQLPENKAKKKARDAAYWKRCHEQITARKRIRIGSGGNHPYAPRRKYATPEERKAADKLKYRETRQMVLDHYGKVCACCGEWRYEFLSIDHINGGGSKHKKEIGRGESILRWLIRNNYPEGFRVLCHNCNQALGHYGFCPHGNLEPVTLAPQVLEQATV